MVASFVVPDEISSSDDHGVAPGRIEDDIGKIESDQRSASGGASQGVCHRDAGHHIIGRIENSHAVVIPAIHIFGLTTVDRDGIKSDIGQGDIEARFHCQAEVCGPRGVSITSVDAGNENILHERVGIK